MKKITIIGAAVLCTAAALAGGRSLSELRQAPERRQAPTLLPGANTRLGGALVYSDKWGAMSGGEYLNPIDAGIYTIEAKENGRLTSVRQINSMANIRAAVMVNNVFYAYRPATGSDYGEMEFVSYSGATWSQSTPKTVAETNLPSDLTYDPVTKKVYGFFNDPDERYYWKFGTLNTSTGTMTQIPLQEMDMRDGHAIAANDKGEIYAIWSALGKLIKIDPVARTWTSIGRTGIYPGDPARGYVNSLTFDDATGKLYWAATDDEGNSGLYEVNTTTGAATLVRNFENNEGFAGLYSLPYETPDEAPAAVSDLAVTFEAPGSTKGTISFTAPLLNMAGNPLSGNLDIIININGEERVKENVAPGTRVTHPCNLTPGETTVEVTPCSDDYRGEAAAYSCWAGFDIPDAPLNLSLTEKEGFPHLTWEAPLTGQHNAFINTDALTYRIVRLPDNVEVATGITTTEYTDLSLNKTAAVYYQVYAATDEGESNPAETAKLVMGDGFTIPFSEGFDTEDAFSLWSIVDLNGGTTWQYNAANKYIYSTYATPDQATDDWIISPKIRMEEGKTYALTFDSRAYNKNYPENFSFHLGTGVRPEDMTIELCRKEDYRVTTFETTRVVFQSPGTGYYHLGIYTNSIPRHWELKIDNVGIEEVDSRIPAKPTGLNVTPGAEGALSATLSFAMPLTDAKGNKLTEKLSARIYTEGNATPLTTLNDNEPGAALTWEDSDIATSGIRKYRVTAVTEAGESEPAEASAFVGVDAPGAVKNLTATETEAGVVLRWDAPTEGANGGYFNPEGITYKIVRSLDVATLAEAATGTSFTDTSLKLSKQELMYYLVTPYIGIVKGTAAYTPMHQVYGPAYEAPFAETFPNADMKYYPWTSDSDGSQYVWSLDNSGINPVTTDQNGDNGLATFVSVNTPAGITGHFYSPKIKIVDIARPELSFQVYHSAAADSEKNESLQVMVSYNGGEFEAVGAPILRDNGTEGWQRHAFSIGAPGDELRIMFCATTLGGGNIYLDNICVQPRAERDVEVSSFSGPGKVCKDIEVDLRGRVSNNGNEDVSNLEVTLFEGYEQIGSTVVPLLRTGMSADVTIPATFTTTGTKTLTMRVSVGDDDKTENDFRYLTVNVTNPVVPKALVTDVQTYNNQVNLVWLSPLYNPAVTEDVESHTDWAIDNIGEWTMIDRDFDNTYRINKDLDTYPNEHAPKAFQVCNAASLGIDIWDQGRPHSGNKMFMAMASINTQNSDWMVSPRLNGDSQAVSFWAKSFTTDGIPAERMRFHYSAHDTAPEEMIRMGSDEYFEVPEEWTEYSFILPEGTRHFAIECVSDNAFALFIDDIRFNDLTVPAGTPVKYEIYRDGVKVAETASESYTEEWVATGNEHKYAIRTIFSNGMDSMSDVVKVSNSSGIDDIADDGSVYDVFSVSGLMLMQQADLKNLRTLDAGIYILRSEKNITKLVIK